MLTYVEIVSFFLMIGVSLGFLIWGLSKNGFHSIIAIPPLLFIFYAVFNLNFDPTLTEPQPDFCAPVRDNATVTGNTTAYGNSILCQSTDPITRNLDPIALQSINYSMLVGMLSVFFIVFRRVMVTLGKRDKDEEA